MVNRTCLLRTLLAALFCATVSGPALTARSDFRIVGRVHLEPFGWSYWGRYENPSEAFLSYDILSGERGPVLVCADRRVVQYVVVDKESMRAVRTNRFSSNERPVVSANGRYVAVMTTNEDRTTGKVLRKISVEDWQGEILWRVGAEMLGEYEPTAQGLLIAYPKCPDSPGGEEDLGRLVPDPRDGGLVVYDRHGSPCLWDFSDEPIACGFCSALSPDGAFLVIASGVQGVGGGDARKASNDSVNLVLYDLEKRKSVGSGTIRESDVLSLNINSDGNILCIATVPGVRHFSAYLFDRDGNTYSAAGYSEYHRALPVGEPVLSSSGRFCGMTVQRELVYALSMTSGRLLWEFRCPSRFVDSPSDSNGSGVSKGIRCLSVTDDGGGVLYAGMPSEREQYTDQTIWVIDSTGTVTHELDLDKLRLSSVIRYGWLSEDATDLWLIHGSELVRCRLPGSDRE